MNDIVLKHIKGEPVTDGDIAMALHDVCESVHSSCDSECPVFKINGGVPLETQGRGNLRRKECSCFKHGSAMLAFIREKMDQGYSL